MRQWSDCFITMAQYNHGMHGSIHPVSADIADCYLNATGTFFKFIHGTLNQLLLAGMLWPPGKRLLGIAGD